MNTAHDYLVPIQENGFDCGVYVLKFIHSMMRIDSSKISGHDLVDGLFAKITNNPHFKFTAEDITTLRRHCYVLIKNIQNIHDSSLPMPPSPSVPIDNCLESPEMECKRDKCPCHDGTKCLHQSDKANSREMALTLCKGHVVSYKDTTNPENIVKTTKVNEITYDKRLHFETITFDDGVQLDADRHLLCVNRFFIRSLRETIPNPQPIWDNITNFLLVPSLYVDGSKVQSSLPKRSQKYKRKNHRVKSSIGFKKYQHYHKWYRLLHSTKLNAKATRVPPFMSKTKSKDPVTYRKNAKTLNLYYRSTIEYGQSARFYKSQIIESMDQAAFDRIKKRLKVCVSQYKTKGAVQLNMPKEKEVIYTNPTGDDNERSIRQNLVEENVLRFEHTNKTRTIMVCPSCRENVMLKMQSEDAKSKHFQPGLKTKEKCTSCKDLVDEHYLRYNLHPIWYERDSSGKKKIGADGKHIVRYDIPSELQTLTMPEKLLIRRYAPYIPSVHIRNGNYGIRGNCVAFPQDITDVCNELPRKKGSVITVIRQLKNRDSSQTLVKQMRVRRKEVLGALRWLKIHHEGYHDITINEDNFWFVGDECNLAKDARVIEVDKGDSLNEEEEFVSKAHRQFHDDDDEDRDIQMATMHTNEPPPLPRGEQAQPVVELIKTARENDKLDKTLDFPPIDIEPVS